VAWGISASEKIHFPSQNDLRSIENRDEFPPTCVQVNLQELNLDETFPEPQFTILEDIGSTAGRFTTWDSGGLVSNLRPSGFASRQFDGWSFAAALERCSMTHLYSDNRRILLIDQNTTKQNLRATILRNYEIEVHTASSVADAASLTRTHTYDLVLLAAQENSEQAAALCTQIRAIRPRQRIGLLVGPPAFVRELAGVRRDGARKKAVSVGGISTIGVVENHSEPVSAPHASSPQWQEMIRKLVSNWYVDQNALFGSPS
jgi:CheY-like chemotaxis protein